jgi:DNA-binding beta-propeller fold protein YncE
LPKTVTVNELTTVASVFTAARFINGEAISGSPLGLKIAAGTTPNLVDLETGGWGKVIVNPGNSTWTTTLANFDTLGSLISAFFTVANDDWRTRFLKAATPTDGTTPKNTLEAMAGIAREPWANPKDHYALFDEAYPQPEDGARRRAPFAPYLAYTPTDFTLSLWFGGGGSYSNGNMVFDAEGNMWCGQNWLAGSQSGVRKSTGGGLIKFSPNGTARSPAITGFTGMGVDGIGWSTAVALDKVWVASFNGAIGVHDFQGRTIGKETDIPFAGKTGGLMGIAVAPNGDVWIADGSKNQLLLFPGGRLQDGRIVHVAGLASPFGIAIDPQNRVYVSNSQANSRGFVRASAGAPSVLDAGAFIFPLPAQALGMGGTCGIDPLTRTKREAFALLPYGG